MSKFGLVSYFKVYATPLIAKHWYCSNYAFEFSRRSYLIFRKKWFLGFHTLSNLESATLRSILAVITWLVHRICGMSVEAGIYGQLMNGQSVVRMLKLAVLNRGRGSLLCCNVLCHITGYQKSRSHYRAKLSSGKDHWMVRTYIFFVRKMSLCKLARL